MGKKTKKKGFIKRKGEVWAVCGLNSNYLISNYGNVYSKINDGELSPYLRDKSKDKTYYCVGIGNGNKDTYVHILVADAFVKAGDCKGKIVHHIDGNTLNNNVDNLMYLSQSDHLKLHRFLIRIKKMIKDNSDENKRDLKELYNSLTSDRDAINKALITGNMFT